MTTPARVVLIVSPNWLGDAVMALPAIADLKRHLAPARMVVSARRGVADVLRLAPAVDDVITTTWRGQWFRPGALRADVDFLRQSEATLAVLFPNSFASGWLVHRAGIAERWGYATDLRSRLLTRAVSRPRGSRHQAEYYQHMVRELGAASGPQVPELRVADATRAAARELLVSRGWNGTSPLVTLAPGAAYGRAKQWLPAHVVSLVINLVRDGMTCALVGSRDDQVTVGQIVAALPNDHARQVIDLAGATTLDQLAGVLAMSRACVSNDSGAMHVAAALGTPVVALFGPTIERETRPLPAPGSSATVLTAPVWCRPCMLRECPLDHRCMRDIAPAMVVEALREIPSPPMLSGREP